MTQVALNISTAYLAGPMRGIEDHNFPEFHRQAQFLRACGWTIFSPAERDEADPALAGKLGINGARGLDYFMQFDLPAVCTHDAVICLPGWERSQGARLETVTAVEIRHPVFQLIVDALGQGMGLKSIDPDYIQAVFAERGPIEGYDLGPWAEPNDILLNPNPEVMGHRIEGSWEEPTALPTDSAGRKAVPLATGVLDYFPAALVEVAKVSKAGNDKHNPGQPLHHARRKSTDHANSLLRHLVDRGEIDADTGQRHSAEVAWRALALLQQELEDAGLAPLPRGAKAPEISS